MFIPKLKEWLEKRPALAGYARVTAYRRHPSKYFSLDTTQALDLILKHGDDLMELCQKRDFISTEELKETLHVFRKGGAIRSLTYWGLPTPLIDEKRRRKKSYNAKELTTWIQNIKQIKGKKKCG